MPNERRGNAAFHDQGALTGAFRAAFSGVLEELASLACTRASCCNRYWPATTTFWPGDKTLQDDRLPIAFLTDLDCLHLGFVVVADDEGVEAARSALDRILRYDRDLA